MERHAVEVTFEGELVASYSDRIAAERLYKTPDDTYFVHIDSRSFGGEAVLETGHSPSGFSEREVEVMEPELLGSRTRR
jgi:hypothetical protein